MDDLEKRVKQFNTLSLPGQSMSMHMGTLYLVNDLWREVERLRGVEAAASVRASAPSVEARCPQCGGDYFVNETILENGELGCSHESTAGESRPACLAAGSPH
jgi:hypothetical protein